VQSLPVWFRKFVIDAVETALAAVFAVTFAFPQSVEEAGAVGVLLLSAVAGALISAARRAIPSFIEWLRDVFAVKEE
jgi:hypothetical protein